MPTLWKNLVVIIKMGTVRPDGSVLCGCARAMLTITFALVCILKGASPQFATRLPGLRIAGRDPMCVPSGTCTAQMGQVIDPRIVGQQTTCRSGQVLCLGVAGGEECGRRFASVALNDGPAPEKAHPWQVYITNQTGYTGSGVLIDSTHVLTAAHKVAANQRTPERITVYLGVYNPPTATNITRFVERVDIAEGYFLDPSKMKDDIAVLKLTEAVPLGYRNDISTLCLPVNDGSNIVINSGTQCMVAGWGMTAFQANDAPVSPMKQVTVQVVGYNECLEKMSKPDVLGSNAAVYLDSKEICAGGKQSKDACTEDGGAPLTCNINGRLNAVGLVIWGKGCGRKDVYGVYVDVSKYGAFIRSKLY